jgi:hypothetical protein
MYGLSSNTLPSHNIPCEPTCKKYITDDGYDDDNVGIDDDDDDVYDDDDDNNDDDDTRSEF